MGKINRREFVKKSAQGVALATIPMFFNINPMAAFAAPDEGENKLSNYMKHFGVDETMVQKVMADAMSKGGDYCDIFFQHTIYNTVSLQDNAVNRAYSNVDFGVGIRVLKGDQTGYSFTEEITLNSMRNAAKTAANIANESKQFEPIQFKLNNTPDYYPIETLWKDVGIDRKIPFLQKINEKVFSLDKRIIKCNIYFLDETSSIMVINSDGKASCDYQPMTRLGVSCTAEENGKREKNGFNIAARHGIELFTPAKLDQLASESVKRTVELFKAVKPEAGEMEVVLGAGGSGILLHEAIGHGMEADFNRKGESIFHDKINKQVAEKFVNIIDDGTIPNARGAINIDDECNDSKKTYLVEKGILTSYLHDRISAKHYGVEPTGNGRRQSFVTHQCLG